MNGQYFGYRANGSEQENIDPEQADREDEAYPVPENTYREPDTAKPAPGAEAAVDRRVILPSSTALPARGREVTSNEPSLADPLDTWLGRDASESFRKRWLEIQGKFVDDPRLAVQDADGLVSEVTDQIAQRFAAEQHKLAGKWNQGADVSTENLRQALQSYRAFFNRLVS